MTLTNKAISAAQGLASFGWPVFPVNPDTKAPLITGWQSRATCDKIWDEFGAKIEEKYGHLLEGVTVVSHRGEVMDNYS